jgi:hypothetical protein
VGGLGTWGHGLMKIGDLRIGIRICGSSIGWALALVVTLGLFFADAPTEVHGSRGVHVLELTGVDVTIGDRNAVLELSMPS